jgi:hypothetical protein
MVVAKRSPGPFPNVYFPIAVNSEKFRAVKATTKGPRPEAIKTIDDVQPYGGGAGEILWHLHFLDILDKHQLLIPAALANLRQSMSPSVIIGFRYAFLNVVGHYSDAQLARSVPHSIQRSPFPLKAGDVLCVVPKSQVFPL